MEKLNILELRIAQFLRFGVILAGLILLSGWIINFDISEDPFYILQNYSKIPFFDLAEFYFLDQRIGVLVIYFGLIVLISLPLIRVFLMAILFLYSKEYLMAFISFLVLAGLIFSFSFGIEI